MWDGRVVEVRLADHRSTGETGHKKAPSAGGGDLVARVHGSGTEGAALDDDGGGDYGDDDDDRDHDGNDHDHDVKL